MFAIWKWVTFFEKRKKKLCRPTVTIFLAILVETKNILLRLIILHPNFTLNTIHVHLLLFVKLALIIIKKTDLRCCRYKNYTLVDCCGKYQVFVKFVDK